MQTQRGLMVGSQQLPIYSRKTELLSLPFLGKLGTFNSWRFALSILITFNFTREKETSHTRDQPCALQTEEHW